MLSSKLRFERCNQTWLLEHSITAAFAAKAITTGAPLRLTRNQS